MSNLSDYIASLGDSAPLNTQTAFGLLETARQQQLSALREGGVQGSVNYREAEDVVNRLRTAVPQVFHQASIAARSTSPLGARARNVTDDGFSMAVRSEGLSPKLYDDDRFPEYHIARSNMPAAAAAAAAKQRTGQELSASEREAFDVVSAAPVEVRPLTYNAFERSRTALFNGVKGNDSAPDAAEAASLGATQVFTAGMQSFGYNVAAAAPAMDGVARLMNVVQSNPTTGDNPVTAAMRDPASRAATMSSWLGTMGAYEKQQPGITTVALELLNGGGRSGDFSRNPSGVLQEAFVEASRVMEQEALARDVLATDDLSDDQRNFLASENAAALREPWLSSPSSAQAGRPSSRRALRDVLQRRHTAAATEDWAGVAETTFELNLMTVPSSTTGATLGQAVGNGSKSQNAAEATANSFGIPVEQAGDIPIVIEGLRAKKVTADAAELIQVAITPEQVNVMLSRRAAQKPEDRAEAEVYARAVAAPAKSETALLSLPEPVELRTFAATKLPELSELAVNQAKAFVDDNRAEVAKVRRAEGLEAASKEFKRRIDAATVDLDGTKIPMAAVVSLAGVGSQRFGSVEEMRADQVASTLQKYVRRKPDGSLTLSTETRINPRSEFTSSSIDIVDASGATVPLDYASNNPAHEYAKRLFLRGVSDPAMILEATKALHTAETKAAALVLPVYSTIIDKLSDGARQLRIVTPGANDVRNQASILNAQANMLRAQGTQQGQVMKSDTARVAAANTLYSDAAKRVQTAQIAGTAPQATDLQILAVFGNQQ